MHWQGKAKWLLPLAVMSAGLWGCPKEKPAATPPGSPSTNAENSGANGSKMTIAVIPKGTSQSFWLAVKAGAEAAGKEEGVNIDWDGPASETEINEQINLVENKITGGVKGIVLAACNSKSLIKPVQDAIAKGIPVVTVDSGLDKSNDPSYCYIATDNVEGGRLGAKKLAELMGEKGKVGVLGFLQGAVSNDERLQGFNEEIAKHPGIQVASTLYDKSDAGKALELTTNMLTANPDIGGIFGASEPGGVGAGNYIKQNGKSGKIKLVAYDTSADEVRDLQDGIIQALIVQDPYQMGYQGVKEVLNAIHGKPAAKKFIDSGVTVVTMQNFNTPQVQKLLHP